MDTSSYSIGMIIAKNLKAQGITNIDQSSFSKAMEDVFDGNDLALSLEEANNQFREMVENAQRAAGEANKKAGEDFLEMNGKRETVITTETGLQYEIVEESKGLQKPMLLDKVKVHYHGTLIDGTVFDSSVDRNEPISFPLNGVIKGWQEGLQLMTVGSKYRFFIPYDLAYGPRGAGEAIGPFSALIFDVELLAIE